MPSGVSQRTAVPDLPSASVSAKSMVVKSGTRVMRLSAFPSTQFRPSFASLHAHEGLSRWSSASALWSSLVRDLVRHMNGSAGRSQLPAFKLRKAAFTVADHDRGGLDITHPLALYAPARYSVPIHPEADQDRGGHARDDGAEGDTGDAHGDQREDIGEHSADEHDARKGS